MVVRVRRPDALVGADRHRDLLAGTAPLAVALRHEPILVVRDAEELVCTCARCSALGYPNAAENFVGGALFEDECPNEEPPKLTAMTMVHVPGSRSARS